MSEQISSTFLQPAFHCPYCGVLAEQAWSTNLHCHYNKKRPYGQNVGEAFYPKNVGLALCKHCEQISVWLLQKMVPIDWGCRNGKS